MFKMLLDEVPSSELQELATEKTDRTLVHGKKSPAISGRAIKELLRGTYSRARFCL